MMTLILSGVCSLKLGSSSSLDPVTPEDHLLHKSMLEDSRGAVEDYSQLQGTEGSIATLVSSCLDFFKYIPDRSEVRRRG